MMNCMGDVDGCTEIQNSCQVEFAQDIGVN